MKPFKLTIAITGGIAGYKVVDLLDKLKLQKNIKVKLILTQNAIKLFGTKIFTEVCEEVYTDGFLPKLFTKSKANSSYLPCGQYRFASYCSSYGQHNF
jgi:phosphopantothenoylcysteine synthetase/decarboxylase